MQCLSSQTTQDSLNDTPNFLLKTEKHSWQIVISCTHNLSDLTKYRSCICAAHSKQNSVWIKKGRLYFLSDFFIANQQFLQITNTYTNKCMRTAGLC